MFRLSVVSLLRLLCGFSTALCFRSGVVEFGCIRLGLVGVTSVFLGLVQGVWVGVVRLLIYGGGIIVMFAYFLAICPNDTRAGRKVWVGVVGGLLWGMSADYVMPAAVVRRVSVLQGGVLLFLGALLFFALVGVVKIVERHKGPLRPFRPMW